MQLRASPAYHHLQHQRQQLPGAPASLHQKGEGPALVQLQEPLGSCLREGALCRPSHTIADATEPLWLGQCLPQTQPLESKGQSGTSIILK